MKFSLAEWSSRASLVLADSEVAEALICWIVCANDEILSPWYDKLWDEDGNRIPDVPEEILIGCGHLDHDGYFMSLTCEICYWCDTKSSIDTTLLMDFANLLHKVRYNHPVSSKQISGQIDNVLWLTARIRKVAVRLLPVEPPQTRLSLKGIKQDIVDAIREYGDFITAPGIVRYMFEKWNKIVNPDTIHNYCTELTTKTDPPVLVKRPGKQGYGLPEWLELQK